MGADLIPAVDNIHTFDTTITVEAYNDTFGLANDSQYLGRSEEMFLGKINNDPFFGKTDAQMFFELKPTVYGAYPFARKDSVKLDSVVLILNYLETYGDTNTAQTLKVYELDQTNNFTSDSAYLIRKQNFTFNTSAPLSLPGQTFLPRNLNDSVKAFRDTTVNQLRIKLDTAFARRLFNYDTTNAYKTDSIFRSLFKGFAVRSEGSGNAIMGFSLAGINTKLAIYYNYPKPAGAGRDTTVNYFFFTTLSAAANYVGRDYTGTPVASAAGVATPAPFVYLQNSPGTFATIKIPALAGMSNRLIHRAELIAEQIYDISDSVFYSPQLLFLSYYDSIAKEFTVPRYNFYQNITGAFNYIPYGCTPIRKFDGNGNSVNEWRFNISRYIQEILTKKDKYYPLRLSAPFTTVFKYNVYDPATNSIIRTDKGGVGFNPTVAKGRIRLNADPNSSSRIRLRIIYSKL